MPDVRSFLKLEDEHRRNELPPGAYYLHCEPELLPDTSDEGNTETAVMTFAGALLPFFMHNVNNLLVGVIGNLDLASMFLPDLKKVEDKLSGARVSAEALVEFIRGITSLSSIEGSNAGSSGVGDIIRSACGRSVQCAGLELLNDPGASSADTAGFKSTVTGMGTWCILCLGGNGSLSCSMSGSTLSLSWERPESSGRSRMPGGEYAGEVLARVGQVAAGAGFRLILETWIDHKGRISLDLIR